MEPSGSPEAAYIPTLKDDLDLFGDVEDISTLRRRLSTAWEEMANDAACLRTEGVLWTALALLGPTVDVLTRLGLLHARRRDLDAAVRLCRLALSTDPNSCFARSALCHSLYRSRAYSDVVEVASIGLFDRPQDTYLNYIAASSHLWLAAARGCTRGERKRRLLDAVRQFGISKSDGSYERDSLFYSAVALRRLGNTRAAAVRLKQVIEMNPHNEQAYCLLLNCLFRSGQFSELVRAWGRYWRLRN